MDMFNQLSWNWGAPPCVECSSNLWPFLMGDTKTVFNVTYYWKKIWFSIPSKSAIFRGYAKVQYLRTLRTIFYSPSISKLHECHLFFIFVSKVYGWLTSHQTTFHGRLLGCSYLVAGWATPLKNMSASVGMNIPNISGKSSSSLCSRKTTNQIVTP